MSRHVAVIGAGVVGLMCAIEALRAGLRVTIIEPGQPGDERSTSYGNAGWFSSQSVIPPAEPGAWRKVPQYLLDPLGPLAIRPSYLPRIAPWLLRYAFSASTPTKVATIASALRPLLRDAAKLHQLVATEAGLAHLIRPESGLMHVYRSRKQFESDSLGWNIRRKVGVAWREVNGKELRERQPFLTKDYQFGVMVPEGGHCLNPGAYVSGLARYARERGATIVSRKATGFRLNESRLAAVVVEGDEIRCDAAVIAAGAFSGELARAAGSDVPLETERGYHVVFEGTEVGPTIPIMVADRKLIVTMTDRGPRVAGQVEFAGLEAAPDWRRADVLRRLLLDLFPSLPVELPEVRLRYWMGHRPSSPDGKPYIGSANKTRDIILAFGHGHVGLGSSARSGRIVAQLLTQHEPEISIDPFSPRRFSHSS